MAQAPPIQQAGGFPNGYAPPPTWVNEMGQNSGQNMTEPITVPDLNDPKEQEKLRREWNNLRIMRLNGSLSSLRNV